MCKREPERRARARARERKRGREREHADERADKGTSRKKVRPFSLASIALCGRVASSTFGDRCAAVRFAVLAARLRLIVTLRGWPRKLHAHECVSERVCVGAGGEGARE